MNLPLLAIRLDGIAEKLGHAADGGWSARPDEAKELAAVSAELKADIVTEESPRPPRAPGLAQVEGLAQIAPGMRLVWRGESGVAEFGRVHDDPDGREGHVMVELDSMGGELMPVAFETPGGIWRFT